MRPWHFFNSIASFVMTPFQSFLGHSVGYNIKDKNTKFHISLFTYKEFLKKIWHFVGHPVYFIRYQMSYESNILSTVSVWFVVLLVALMSNKHPTNASVHAFFYSF